VFTSRLAATDGGKAAMIKERNEPAGYRAG
jgi:hypothetical protein